MNIEDRKLFIPCYKEHIEPVYCKLINDNFSEYTKKQILKEVGVFRGGFYNTFLSSLKTIFGSANAKQGYFYEKRMYAVYDALKELGMDTKSDICNEVLLKYVGITNYEISEEFSKIILAELELPKKVFKRLPTISRKLFYKKKTREIFTSEMQKLFDLMIENFDEDVITYKRDIDHCIIKDEKIFIVESKTRERHQPHNAYGDVKKLLETWAGLTYALLKKAKLSGEDITVDWNTIGMLFVMNELSTEEAIKYVKYFPPFYSNNLNKGGVISGSDFYWYFLGVNFDDILAVEKYLSGYVAKNAITLIEDLKKRLHKNIKVAKEEYNNYIENLK